MDRTPREVVEQYFDAMQRGSDAADVLFALFDDDAVYTEPFGGSPRTWRGREAIEQRLRTGWDESPPDLELTVERIDVEGQVVTSTWVCRSPAFPGPVRGRDVCTVRDGRIHHLDVRFLP